MRVLVIDSDAVSRIHLKTLLQSICNCEEAEDRESALDLFRKAFETDDVYHLVLVDIQGMDTNGQSILPELRSIESQSRTEPTPKACIFVTTELSGRQLMTDCLMKGADEFLSKPLVKNHLLAKIGAYDLLSSAAGETNGQEEKKRIKGSEILERVNRKMSKGDLDLPPAPKIAMRLRQMIDLNAEIKDVVDLLKQDLSVATKLISVSNSAFYRGVKKNKNLSQATSRLGLERTREVVMSICCRGYFSTNHQPYKEMVEQLWWHCLACGQTTEMILEKSGKKVDEDLYTIGLLHDIGRLLVIQVAGELQQIKKGVVDPEELTSVMDDYHERLGANFLDKMGYPEMFASLVRRHHDYGTSEKNTEAQKILQQADVLSRAAGFGLEPVDEETMAQFMELLEISEEMKTKAIPEIAKRMEQLRYVFG